MISRPVHILRWLGHQLAPPKPRQQLMMMPARITIHSSTVARQPRSAGA
ncbi:MAG: hypothetical protein ABSG43_23105 [Solirubrobacteraceae bacterium]|jgi:hypothetical protein